MKKIILKTKILLTNISRIIMSFLFISFNLSLVNKTFGISPNSIGEITCYDAGPSIEIANTLTFKKVLIIAVPIVFVVGAIVLIVKNKKSKNQKDNLETEEKNENKED